MAVYAILKTELKFGMSTPLNCAVVVLQSYKSKPDHDLWPVVLTSYPMEASPVYCAQQADFLALQYRVHMGTTKTKLGNFQNTEITEVHTKIRRRIVGGNT